MSLNKFAIKLIKQYQTKRVNKNAHCVHVPTCSAYGLECYQKFNFIKATALTTKRILFCTPLNKKVYDPVPLTKEEKIIDNKYQSIALNIKDDILRLNLNSLDEYIVYIYDNTINLNDFDIIFYKRISLLESMIKKKEINISKSELVTLRDYYINGFTKFIERTN